MAKALAPEQLFSVDDLIEANEAESAKAMLPPSEYLSILRDQFLSSFGPISEDRALGFWLAGIGVFEAAERISNGWGPIL